MCHNLKHGVYELQGDEVVSGRGRRPQDRFRVDEIRTWQIQAGGPIDVIVIELANGRTLNWLDTYDDLIAILRRVAVHSDGSVLSWERFRS
jgi:hypothetical protein